MSNEEGGCERVKEGEGEGGGGGVNNICINSNRLKRSSVKVIKEHIAVSRSDLFAI